MNVNQEKTTRRRFLKNSTVAAASVALGLNPDRLTGGVKLQMAQT